MKTLNIQFIHPVSGSMQLKNIAAKTVKNCRFSSDEDFIVQIKSKDLADGDWSVSLEWNHNDQLFLIERKFKIVDEEIVQLTEN